MGNYYELDNYYDNYYNFYGSRVCKKIKLQPCKECIEEHITIDAGHCCNYQEESYDNINYILIALIAFVALGSCSCCVPFYELGCF